MFLRGHPAPNLLIEHFGKLRPREGSSAETSLEDLEPRSLPSWFFSCSVAKMLVRCVGGEKPSIPLCTCCLHQSVPMLTKLPALDLSKN